MAFEQLEAEMTILRKNELNEIMGGDGSAQDMVNYMLANNLSNMNENDIDDWWAKDSNRTPKCVGGNVGVGPGEGGSVGSTDTTILKLNDTLLVWKF